MARCATATISLIPALLKDREVSHAECSGRLDDCKAVPTSPHLHVLSGRVPECPLFGRACLILPFVAFPFCVFLRASWRQGPLESPRFFQACPSCFVDLQTSVEGLVREVKVPP